MAGTKNPVGVNHYREIVGEAESPQCNSPSRVGDRIMTEIPSCELQKYHYQAVRDSMEYRMQGLMDCRQEEMMMNLTTQGETHIIEIETTNKDEMNQLKGHILYLSNKVKELLNKKNKHISYIYSNILLEDKSDTNSGTTERNNPDVIRNKSCLNP